MMMQMNHLICIALMSSFILSSASATFVSEEVKRWTAVFQVIDTNRKGYITEEDLINYFESSKDAKYFDVSTRKILSKLVRENKGKFYIEKFITFMEGESKRITTLQALRNSFPGKTSILGEELNKMFKSNKRTDSIFNRNQYYELQGAAEMIDKLLEK